MKYTKHNLKKIESIFELLGYTVRYEKGSFQSGHCLVENKKIVIINRFFDTEGRMGSLLEILHKIEVDTSIFDDKMAQFFKKLPLNTNQD